MSNLSEEAFDVLKHIASGRLNHESDCGWWEGISYGSFAAIPKDADTRCTCGVTALTKIAQESNESFRRSIQVLFHTEYRMLTENKENNL